ncbi:sialidase family protein [Serratia marcescens]|uniref:sialidase family protein n=1 Tax=Serratia TaxID=613 RepID=UPI000A3E04EB|nr:sialidase family protein [Serratia marcescens]MCA4113363.1 glycoside hydrolase [Serratia marcescens]MDN0028386.1 sialidase family protein [Serratia marcescens]
MTTYNTGNPVGPNGSADPRDLYDNAQAMDLLLNSIIDKTTGRIGNELITWAGLVKNLSPLGKAYTKEQADAAIASGEIPNDAFFFIWSNDEKTIADQYQNSNGVATPTGKNIKSGEFIDLLAKTISELKGMVSYSNISSKTDLLELKDKNGNLYARFDENAELWLTGLNSSVQNLLSSIFLSDSRDLINFKDADGNTYAKIDKSGGLWLVGLDKPVQDLLSTGPVDKTNPILSLQVEPAYSMMAEFLRNTGKPIVNMPIALVKPMNRTGTAWIHNIQADVPLNQDHIVIDTPYRADDGVVHPNLIHVPGKFLGYDYLLAITPYTDMNDQEENPCLYGSNDLLNFTLLPNVDQPIDDTPANTEGRPGYLSDPFWGYNHFTGELMCCYRKTYVIDGNGADNDLFLLLYRSTKDGKTWGAPTILMNEKVGAEDLMLSPSIVYNANEARWYLFYWLRDDVMVFRTNKTLDPSSWSEPVDCGFSKDQGYRGWHLEVKFVGNRLVCLINDYRQTANIYLGISDPDDWSKWEFSKRPLLNKPGNNRGAYKSTFIPEFNDDGEISLTVGWTTGDKTRNLYINRTNYFNAGK